jgi:hypothetical protein
MDNPLFTKLYALLTDLSSDTIYDGSLKEMCDLIKSQCKKLYVRTDFLVFMAQKPTEEPYVRFISDFIKNRRKPRGTLEETCVYSLKTLSDCFTNIELILDAAEERRKRKQREESNAKKQRKLSL